jgi:AcrR family transcriptional regulator
MEYGALNQTGILPVLKTDNLSPRAEGRSSTDRKPKEKRWQQILQAAADVFYEKGYDAATLQAIADRVGILKGSISY